MSVQSDAAKKHIETLLQDSYPSSIYEGTFAPHMPIWYKEYHFNLEGLKKNPKTGRMINDWRFDYAVPALLCAKPPSFLKEHMLSHSGAHYRASGGDMESTQCSSIRKVFREDECCYDFGLACMATNTTDGHQGRAQTWITATRLDYSTLSMDVLSEKLSARSLSCVVVRCVTLPDEPILRKLPWKP